MWCGCGGVVGGFVGWEFLLEGGEGVLGEFVLKELFGVLVVFGVGGDVDSGWWWLFFCCLERFLGYWGLGDL